MYKKGEIATTLAVASLVIMASGILLGLRGNPLNLFSSATPRYSYQGINIGQYPNVMIREDSVHGLPHVERKYEVEKNGKKYTRFEILGSFCFSGHLNTGCEEWSFLASMKKNADDKLYSKNVTVVADSGGFCAGAAYPAQCKRTVFNVGEGHPAGKPPESATTVIFLLYSLSSAFFFIEA